MTPEEIRAKLEKFDDRIRALERDAVTRRDHSKLEERMRVQETTSAKGLAVLAVLVFVASLAANLLPKLL